MREKDIFIPHMPEVDVRPKIGAIFARARAAASETINDDPENPQHQVMIITPGRLLVAKECPLLTDIPVEQLALLSKLMPPSPRQNIAVIGYTFLEALKSDLNRAIPFFGFLLGFGALGHRIWVFEGHESALAAGCEDADLLMVDEAMAVIMDRENPDWRMLALNAMRGEDIRIVSGKS